MYLHDINESTPIQLSEYAKNLQDNCGIAHKGKLGDNAKRRMATHIEGMPAPGQELKIVRGKFLDGHLEVLVARTDKPECAYWINLYHHPELYDVAQFLLRENRRVPIKGHS